jgi:hypothetical protein
VRHSRDTVRHTRPSHHSAPRADNKYADKGRDDAATHNTQGPAWDAASHYGLPSSEQPVQSFSAVNNKLVHGYVTITPAFVCFDTVLFAGALSDVSLACLSHNSRLQS